MWAFVVCTANNRKISDLCPRVLKHVGGYRSRRFPFADLQLLKVVVCDQVDKILHITHRKNSVAWHRRPGIMWFRDPLFLLPAQKQVSLAFVRRMRIAVAVVTHNMLQNEWTEVERRLEFVVPPEVPTLRSANVSCSQKEIVTVHITKLQDFHRFTM